MAILTLEQLWPRSQPTAVFFDIDGTLAPIAAHASQVQIAPAMLAALDALAVELDGAVGILTGRPLHEAKHLLPYRSFAIAAEHGATLRRHDGSTTSTPEISPELEALYQHAQAGVDPLPGVWVERKCFGIAIHYRPAPQFQAQACDLGQRLLTAYPRMTGLHGKMVFELKQAGVDKGTALRILLESEPFRGRLPVVFGDDVTDEHAFLQAQALGGIGVKIGPEPSAAAFSLPCQKDLLPFLEQWRDHLAVLRAGRANRS